MNLPPFKLVTIQKEWLACLSALRREPRLAIDLEANSLFAYREQVCLIQISIPGQDYIVDPTAELALDGLGELLADEETEKVFHAAEYDLILMKRQYGWTLKNLFDTMWAARVLGLPRYGLANLLQDYFGVEQNKKHQKANWCRRPINKNMLAYAQIDTHYLLQLREALVAELQDNHCLAEAQEIFADQCHIDLNDNSFNPDGFWSINGTRDLSPSKRAIVKDLYIFRDQQARRRNRPPFKIFNNRTIIELAEADPRYLEELSHIHGMSTGQIRRYGRSILEVISRARKAPPPKRPKPPPRPPDEVSTRYEKLHNWRKITARKRGVESDVIISRGALWALAWANPQTMADLGNTEKIGPWRKETYGPEILALLNKSRK